PSPHPPPRELPCIDLPAEARPPSVPDGVVALERAVAPAEHQVARRRKVASCRVVDGAGLQGALDPERIDPGSLAREPRLHRRGVEDGRLRAKRPREQLRFGAIPGAPHPTYLRFGNPATSAPRGPWLCVPASRRVCPFDYPLYRRKGRFRYAVEGAKGGSRLEDTEGLAPGRVGPPDGGFVFIELLAAGGCGYHVP